MAGKKRALWIVCHFSSKIVNHRASQMCEDLLIFFVIYDSWWKAVWRCPFVLSASDLQPLGIIKLLEPHSVAASLSRVTRPRITLKTVKDGDVKLIKLVNNNIWYTDFLIVQRCKSYYNTKQSPRNFLKSCFPTWADILVLGVLSFTIGTLWGI